MQIIKEHVDKSSLKKRRFKASLSNDYLKDLLLNAIFLMRLPCPEMGVHCLSKYFS